jgi:hypothetical protein
MPVVLDYRIGASSNKRRVRLASEHGEGNRKTVTCCLWGCSCWMLMMDQNVKPAVLASRGAVAPSQRSGVLSRLSHQQLFDMTTLVPSDDVALFRNTLRSLCSRLGAIFPTTSPTWCRLLEALQTYYGLGRYISAAQSSDGALRPLCM